MLKLYLVRHGETDWNAAGRMQGMTDVALNETGLKQARRLAARLAHEGAFEFLYTSPLQRAHKTAEIIGKRLGLSAIVDARLVEHHIGQLEGMTRAEVKEQYPDIYRAWSEGAARPSFPGEEARDDFHRRLHDFFTEVQARHPAGKVLVVTHGGALSMALAALLNLDLNRRFPFWIDNASLTILEMRGAFGRLDLMNDTCHLRDDHHFDGAEQFFQDEKSTSATAGAPTTEAK